MLFNLNKLIIFFLVVILINICLYKKNELKLRESRLEVLRIIAMILIVAHHYSLHGFNFFNLDLSLNKVVLNFLIIGGKIGVNLFVMISSYYLIDSKFSLKKIISLILKVKIYAFIFLIIFWNISEGVTINNLIRSIFPIIYSLYWFISAYLIMYLITPLLNVQLKNLEKNIIKEIGIISILIYSIFSHLMGGKLFYSSVIWFVILYVIVYYIKNYINLNLIPNVKLKLVSILSYFLIFLSIITFDLLGKYVSIFQKYSIYFILENSILVLIFSISFFLIFLKKESFKNNIINYIASGTLGVYLVHENVFVRPFLYNKILNNLEYLNKGLIIFVLYSIFSIVFIFCLGLCIDKILSIFIEKIVNSNFVEKIEYLIKKVLEIIIKKLEKYER